jgi:tRNA-binding protein
MLIGDPTRSFDVNAGVPNVFRIHDDHRPMTALVHAAGVVDANSVLQAGLLHATLELRVNGFRPLPWARLPMSAHEHMTLILPHGPNNTSARRGLLRWDEAVRTIATVGSFTEYEPRMPTPDDFAAIDIRVGTVLIAEPFPEARKPSLKLRIDFGPELGVKQSSAQLTTRYTPELLVGRQVIAAVNIGTRRIAGFLSEVLVLGAMASASDVVLLEVAHPVENGTRIA